MQKKIIALAIAAAISAPAFADTSNVTVYGKANLSYDSINTGTSAAGVAGATSNRVSSNTSLIGLKGSEDLGDGLSAVWQIETVVGMDGGGTAAATTLGSRNTFAGLSSASAGTVVLGRHDTPYKIATRKYDMFGDGIADNRSLMGATGSATAAFDGRQADVIAYISPAMSGFTGAIAYVNLNQALNVAQNLSTSTKATALSLTGMYDVAPFSASLSYEEHNLGTIVLAAGSKEKATKLGLGYAQDALSAGFAYEKTSDNSGAGNTNLFGHSAYYLSGKYSFGNDAVKLAYTHKGNDASNATAGTDDSANQISVGYDHSMSKRTTVYALYSKMKVGAAGAYSLSTNGTSAAMAGGTSAGAGASPSVLSFGLRHTF